MTDRIARALAALSCIDAELPPLPPADRGEFIPA